MNLKIRSIIYIGLCFMVGSMSSCSELFNGTIAEIELPEHTPVIAPYAFFADVDSSLTVMVGNSIAVLDNGQARTIEGATVELFKDGTLFQTLPFNEDVGGYQLNLQDRFTQSSGETYELKVQAPNFETVTSTQIMPSPVEVDSVEVDFYGGIDEFGDEVDNYTFHFKDPAGVKNYYQVAISINVQYEDPNDPAFNYEYTNVVYPSSLDRILEEGGVFTDDNIDGNSYSLTIYDYPSFFGTVDPDTGEFELPEGFTVRVNYELRSISKDFYLYQKTFSTYENTEGDPFAEPVLVHTNFTGGLGMFGIYSTYRRELVID